jgi:hypothetical protein
MGDLSDRKNKGDSDSTKNTNQSGNKEKKGKDYWDRVADDVASGYKSDEDENNVLNIDQEPGDHEPGDKNPT